MPVWAGRAQGYIQWLHQRAPEAPGWIRPAKTPVLVSPGAAQMHPGDGRGLSSCCGSSPEGPFGDRLPFAQRRGCRGTKVPRTKAPLAVEVLGRLGGRESGSSPPQPPKRSLSLLTRVWDKIKGEPPTPSAGHQLNGSMERAGILSGESRPPLLLLGSLLDEQGSWRSALAQRERWGEGNEMKARRVGPSADLWEVEGPGLSHPTAPLPV